MISTRFRTLKFPFICLALLLSLRFTASLPATPITVDYVGASGLNAQAVFDLANNGNTLCITLTNDSVSPFGNVDGSANMVLSSINFDLGATLITGGTVMLNGGSNVVHRVSGNWDPVAAPDLQAEFGYSNTGIGNVGGASLPNALHAVTSHSNGGNAVTNFNGVVGGVGGGLDYALVAAGSSAFGNNEFILDSVVIKLDLDSPLANLDFLSKGSYVEFGSDHLYVVPEPGMLGLTSLSGLGLVFLRTRRRRMAG